MTRRHHHRLPFGAELVAPDRARFRLWAPTADAVSLLVPGRGTTPMTTAGDGWYECETAAHAGLPYRYRVTPRDGDPLDVPDPASRAQAGDVHDPSVVVDPEAYLWEHDDWAGRAWCETVIYELHVGLVGGFDAARKLLPGLADLGITAIELMPIADFVGPRNWGYDGVLPFAPDASYGSPDELKRFVDEAHGHGLMVFLDVVYNHFGPDGNFIGVYCDDFFRDDLKTPWGRAIDFRRREVRTFFCQNALYWLLEFRFDGLRLDATHSIVPQDWLEELRGCVGDAIDPARHLHLAIEHEGNAAHLLGPHRGYDAQWNDDGHHVLHALLTGESDGYYMDFADGASDKLARCLAEGFVYQGQPSIFRKGEPRGESSIDLPPSAFILFLQNHDQIGNRAFGERLTTLADDAALKAASTLLLLSPQVPLLFMGEELGETTPFLYFTSYPDAELATAIREGRRAEFGTAKGFADEATRARIPDPNAPSTFEASRIFYDLDGQASTPRRAEWLAHTRELLALRASLLAPRFEGARALGAEAIGPRATVARWHLGDGAVLTIAVNLDARPVEVAAHRFRVHGDLIHATPADSDGPEGVLPAHTTWVFLEPAT